MAGALTPAALCVAKRHLAEVTALGYNEAAYGFDPGHGQTAAYRGLQSLG